MEVDPCCSTFTAVLLSLPKVSRGTPRPAESLRMTKLRVSGLKPETVSGCVLTATSVLPLTGRGGRGGNG